jgi:hypothetical protein
MTDLADGVVYSAGHPCSVRGDVEALADVLGRVRDHMRSAPPRSAAPRRRKTSES